MLVCRGSAGACEAECKPALPCQAVHGVLPQLDSIGRAHAGLGDALALFLCLGRGILRALGGGFCLVCLLLCVLAGCSFGGRLRCQLQRFGRYIFSSCLRFTGKR